MHISALARMIISAIGTSLIERLVIDRTKLLANDSFLRLRFKDHIPWTDRSSHMNRWLPVYRKQRMEDPRKKTWLLWFIDAAKAVGSADRCQDDRCRCHE